MSSPLAGYAGPAPEAVPRRLDRMAPHLVVPGVLLAVVAVGWLLRPVPPGTSGLRLAGVRLPEVCALHRATGVRCPGCGLTRSWVAAVHGKLGWSIGHHRLGWLLLLYLFLQAGRHAAHLVWRHGEATLERYGAHLDRGVILLAVLLFLNWIPTLVEDLSR